LIEEVESMDEFFPILILNARPAAGKSEIIAYLKQLTPAERITRFHIGPLHILDDFPMLWTWFEEDDILARILKRPRLHTTAEGYFIHDDLWHLLIRRLSLEYHKWQRDLQEAHTCIIEFSRGTSIGGYQNAYQHLSKQILELCACLYINVSYEESKRKNLRRANVERLDSILEHSLEEEKMDKLYRDDDWSEFTADDPDYITVNDITVPYSVLNNEDDVTTQGGEALETRLEDCLNRLWTLWHQREAV
jgi:hypothetical protein